MKTINYFSALGLVVLLFGCHKTDHQPARQLANAADFLSANRVQAEHFSFDAGTAFTAETTKGSKFTFPAGAFRRQNGDLVAGMVELDILEVRTKKEILFSGIPTESFGNLLESGGEFHLKATQQGEELVLVQSAMVHFPADPLPLENDMQLFVAGAFNEGAAGDGNAITWSLMGDGKVRTANGAYAFPWDYMGWCNLDRFADLGTGTDVYVDIDPGRLTGSATGAAVYIVFEDVNSVVTLPYDADRNIFTNNGTYYTNMCPVGQRVILIVMAESANGNLVLAAKRTTLAEDLRLTLTPMEVTEAEAASVFDGL